MHGSPDVQVMRISLPCREKPLDLDINMEAWSENREKEIQDRYQ